MYLYIYYIYLFIFERGKNRPFLPSLSLEMNSQRRPRIYPGKNKLRKFIVIIFVYKLIWLNVMLEKRSSCRLRDWKQYEFAESNQSRNVPINRRVIIRVKYYYRRNMIKQYKYNSNAINVFDHPYKTIIICIILIL